MISSQRSKIAALLIEPKLPLVSSGAESSSWKFVFLGSEEQKEIVSRDFLKNTSIKESAYVNLLPEIQTFIHALQKIDPLAKRW